MDIEILTRCTRPDRLDKVHSSIFSSAIPEVNIKWRIIFDTSALSLVDSKILTALSYHELCFWEGIPGDMGHGLLNRAFDLISNDAWIYVLDDDNEMHPDFFREIYNEHIKNPKKTGFIVSQFIGGRDFTGLEVREAKAANVKLQGIDMAQFIIKKSLMGDKRLIPMTYVADGIFIEDLYNANKKDFYIVKKILCNYNSLQDLPQKSHMLPRVLVIGKDPGLKSSPLYDFESNDLNVRETTAESLHSDIAEFDPDTIVTYNEDPNDFAAMNALPTSFRQRWIHIDINSPNAGESAYFCGMHYALNPNLSELVSIFTPIYNTKEKLFRTYRSIQNQTYTNWEWILVNDSTDDITLKIAEDIAAKDPRVKVYDFKKKTKGMIGEAKYRACCMSTGAYLLELDHDDYLLPHALDKCMEAFNKFPDAGFVYTDAAEVDEHYNSLTYGEGFAFGYGAYREETHLGIVFKVATTTNINPMTIRHIVGVPNHIRMWKRDLYFKIGGHNRRLSITDDYELLMRTFLTTRMVKIELCCYLQFYHNNNSQNATRSDIQRRVRTIAVFYGDQIRARFEELGKEDWGWTGQNPPWNIVPRTGDEEGYVNYIL